MAPKFDADIRHWPTLDAFVAYLATIPRPTWCKGITDHNTYVPDESQWRGIASVESCMRSYIGKGWVSGPQLFVAAEAPRSSDCGIFQLTPIQHQGTHAGGCNAGFLGQENVGDFNRRPPSPAQYRLLLDVNRAILSAWQLSPDNVKVHNECMPGRTCPGKFLTGTQIRADLRKPVAPEKPTWRLSNVLGLPIYQRQAGTGPLAGYLIPGEIVQIDMTYANGMGHLADGRGFVDMDGLRNA